MGQIQSKELSIIEITDNSQLPPTIESEIQQLQKEYRTLILQTGSYKFSPINSDNKHSTGYYDCIGLAATAQRPNDNSEILSFLSHQDPKKCNSYEEFLIHLEEKLRQLKSQIDPRTIRANLFGGTLIDLYQSQGSSKNLFDISQNNRYQLAMKQTTAVFKKVFGFSPKIALDPSLHTEPMDAFLNSSGSTLYIVRPDQPSLQTFFNTSDIPNKIPEWRSKVKNTFAA